MAAASWRKPHKLKTSGFLMGHSLIPHPASAGEVPALAGGGGSKFKYRQSKRMSTEF